jgi:hypothetical protein
MVHGIHKIDKRRVQVHGITKKLLQCPYTVIVIVGVAFSSLRSVV